MAWAILFTVIFLHGAHMGLGFFNLFKKIPEPTVPIRRHSFEWQDWRPSTRTIRDNHRRNNHRRNNHRRDLRTQKKRLTGKKKAFDI